LDDLCKVKVFAKKRDSQGRVVMSDGVPVVCQIVPDDANHPLLRMDMLTLIQHIETANKRHIANIKWMPLSHNSIFISI
jgi:hypothetical protein